MRYLIKQNPFSFSTKFDITDENHNPILTVDGSLLSFRRKMEVFDMEGNQVATIQKRIGLMMPTFDALVDNKEITISQKFTLLQPRFELTGINWDIEGNIFYHEYSIIERNSRTQVAVISKKFLSFSDSYTLDIERGDNILEAITVVLALDCIIDDIER